jgi:hypothetical protein
VKLGEQPSSSGARSRLVGLHAAGQTDSARLRAASWQTGWPGHL